MSKTLIPASLNLVNCKFYIIFVIKQVLLSFNDSKPLTILAKKLYHDVWLKIRLCLTQSRMHLFEAAHHVSFKNQVSISYSKRNYL